MPARADSRTPYVPGRGNVRGHSRKVKRKAKPVKVSAPYAPTRKGKRAEETARGKTKVPYAPTPAGKAAERKARKTKSRRVARTQRRQAERESERIVRKARRLLKAPASPQQEYQRARYGGVAPSAELREKHPRAYRKASRAFSTYHGKREALKEDPLAELAISAGATGGLGLAAKGVATAARGALAAREAEKVAETGARSIAARATSRAGTKARAGAKRIKTAPKRAAKRVKETPGRVKSAPGRARRAVKTKEGRRAARKGATRRARRHPVRTGYGATAVSPVPLPGDADKRARAAAEGTFKAVVQHPGETLQTTLRSLPGAITGPAALIGSAAQSAIHGTPKPLVEEAEGQAEGIAKIASNVFSGDPQKAEKAAREEGSLAFLAPLPAASRLKVVKRGRTRVRKGAANARRRVAKKGEAANRSVRHAPREVEQTVLGTTGRRQARKKTAQVKQRADNPQRVAAAHHEREITKRIAKAPKGSHVALQTLAEYGIRDAKGAALVRRDGPGDAQLTKALDYVDSHPEIFQSKAFQEALGAVERASRTAPAAIVGKGERARLMQQGDVLGITRPEDAVPPAAREFTGANTREGAWMELAAADKRLNTLRRKGRQRLDQAKVLKGKARERALREGKALYAEARQLQKSNQRFYNALDPFTRPGQKIDSSSRTAYEGRMLEEYKQAVESARSGAGLAPAIWTHHAEANTAGRGEGMGTPFPTAPGRVVHMREGNLARADNLDRSLEALLRGTVQMPRLRAAGKQFGRDFVKEFATPFTLDGKRTLVGQGSKDWTAITSLRSKDNPNGGQFDPKSWARFPLREWKNAVKDPYTQDSRLVELLTEAEAGRIKGSEPWVLMPREAIKEARAQISPEINAITTGANALSRAASRTILGTNPAWAVAQIVAEGIPLLMAKPSLLNPAKLARLERDVIRFRKEHPEEALALQATAGASPLNAAVNRTPLDLKETYTPQLWDKGARALTRGRSAKAALSFAKLRALGIFDVKRQNEYRTILAAAEADKRFRSWHSGVTGLFDSSAKLSREFRGKPRAELWKWLTTTSKGKAELTKITDYVDAIQGNWTTFTRYERSLAPLAIFYPFLRYSLRWTLWTFPKEHPVTATLAYVGGQANAEQLEKLAGGPLPNPIAYAFPAYQNERGETAVLPGGSRISPGQSSLTQAIATGTPSQILSSANPFLGAGLTALTGIEPFTGEKASEGSLVAALNSLLAMPAPLRVAGVKFGEQSTASKAFGQYNPEKNARSVLFPFIPQSGEKFGQTEKLARSFDTKYSGPVPSLPAEVWDAAYKQDWRAADKLRRERIAAERAGDRIKVAETPFFEESGDLSKEGSEILRYITGQLVIPSDDVKRPRKGRRMKGIGGGEGGGIGGYSLSGGSIGGVGGGSGGGIGGRPLP